MPGRSWVLSGGVELPEPEVPICLRRESVEGGELPAVEFRRERPTPQVARREWYWRLHYGCRSARQDRRRALQLSFNP